MIITGRNGSGKSSFAEALEFVLTGATYRSNLETRFGENSRCLHHPRTAKIVLGLAQESVGRAELRASWAPTDLSLTGAKVSYQAHGRPQQSGRDALGWTRALETYRPILSYDELGRILHEKNAQLHDALRQMLGLESLAEAQTRLAGQLATIRRPLTAADRERRDLRTRAAEIDDIRYEQP